MTHNESTGPRLPRQRSTEPDLGEVFDAVRTRRVTDAHSQLIGRHYPRLAALTTTEWTQLVDAMDTIDTDAGDGAEALGRILRVADDLGVGVDFLRFLLDMLRAETSGEGQ